MVIPWHYAGLDILLVLVQVNVALGALYIGLPVARYRVRLYDSIIDLLARQSFSESDVWGEQLRRPSIQKAYNQVSLWVGEILENKAGELEQVVTRVFDPEAQKEDQDAEELDWQYRWFRSNWDRVVVTIVNFLPVYLVLGPFAFPACEPPVWLLASTIFAGHAILVSHLYIGRTMVIKQTDAFKASLRVAVNVLKAGATSNLVIRRRPIPRKSPPNPHKGPQ